MESALHLLSQTVDWHYAYLLAIELHPEEVRLTCGLEADFPSFVVTCAFEDLRALAPYARLLEAFLEDRVAFELPLIPYHHTGDGCFGFSSGGAHYDYPPLYALSA